jgi:hypothetical protein
VQLAPPADDCPAQGLVRCGDACIDTGSDVFNCGGCGLVCGVFDACVDGACVAPEDQTQPAPDEAPADASGQPAETTDTAPVADALVCGPGLINCNGTCADLAVDPANCGMCGLSCGADLCVDGLCVAQDTTAPADAVVVEAPPLIEDCSAQGLTDCGGACIDTSADPFNCGSCGLICAEGQACSGGACA